MHKIRRTTSVVVDQPSTEKIIVENMPETSFSTDDVSYYICSL